MSVGFGQAAKMASLILAGEMEHANDQINGMLKGRKVRILSDYNGQDMGTSRPSLKGRVFTVTWACYDRGSVTVGLDGPRHLTNAVDLKEVEVL